ncbi:MAG: pyrimidine operon attenuation protein / uracil phosphoribosyltransferase [Solirubrobacteraceae bacterium]|jgi:pyrimidine operon attenuation protein/uracil phosphoribosyltransferase|nr:pyrimidine operon attenuation protein / uracil phosphoribosyltransferase [Solirubrobacteraceae bacterium]
MRRTLVRIAHEIVEKNPDGQLAIVGIHRRGAHLARRLHALTSELVEPTVPLGSLDISFYRDDLDMRVGGSASPVVHSTELEFPIAGRTIVIVDDVLYTGRTVRAAIGEVFDFGRPARVQLAVLVDRGHRELPIRPDYVGKNIPTSQDQRVNVRVEEVDGADEVTVGPAEQKRSKAAAGRLMRPPAGASQLDGSGAAPVSEAGGRAGSQPEGERRPA